MAVSSQVLVSFIVIASLMSVVQTQSQLDMLMSAQPKRIELPVNYNKQQTEYLQLHPFKIKFQAINQRNFENIAHQPIDRLFYITSFFYSILIKVQNIPSSQTTFPIDLDGKGRCYDYIVDQNYIKNGFKTKDQDLIIFTRFEDLHEPKVGSSGGACVVQRRPIYGLLKFEEYYFTAFQDNANFHNTVLRLIHTTLHIVGFNTNFLVRGQHTLITELPNHQNDTTFFFASASQDKRLQVKQVIAVDYGNLNLPIIKTKRVKQAVRQIFECPQIEQVGAALQTVQDSDENKYVRFHWHPQIYQDQFMVFIQIGRDQNNRFNFHLQNQQLRLSKLSWAMLQDTGFYQFVDHSLTDNFKPRTLETYRYEWNRIDQHIIPKCQMHKHLYAQRFFKAYKHCNVYGTSMRNTYFSNLFDKRIQDSSKFQQNKCTKMSTNFRCIQIQYVRDYLSSQLYQECTLAECFEANNIRILFNNIWYNVCTRQQAGKTLSFRFRTNHSIHCPSDFDAFCGEKTCLNWCQKQGICINGQCFYPQNRFQGQIKMQSLHYGFYEPFKNRLVQSLNNFRQKVDRSVCQKGCVDCYCQNCQDQNYYRQYCRVKKIHENNFNDLFPICSSAFKTCIGNSKVIVPCFQSYFFLNERCYRCDSSCTHCQQTYGSRQMINVCKNCQEGSFPFASICKSCQVENCISCKDKGKCFQCKVNYYLATLQDSTNVCIRCLSTCGICDPSCGQGFFLNQNECQTCIAFCKKCTNNLTCLQCHKGFFYKENLCIRPCELPCYQCVLGKPSKCLSCVSYHIYNPENYSCEQIQIASDWNCPLGYISINHEYQWAKCQPIPIENCLIAKRGSQLVGFSNLNFIIMCNSCIKGFFVDQKGQCSHCPQGCSFCFQFDICSVCDDGYSNPKNRDGSRDKARCLKCIQNCLQCPASPNQCQLCSNNYNLIGTGCHSINQVRIQLTFDVDYTEFVMGNKLQAIKKTVQKLIDQKSKIQINQLVKGSAKVLGIISRTFEGQVEKDCMLSFNLTSKFSNTTSEFQFPLIEASFTNNIPQCDNFSPNATVQIVYIISGAASILVIILIIIIVYLVKKLAYKEKIILKFEELQSRPQYQGENQNKIGF